MSYQRLEGVALQPELREVTRLLRYRGRTPSKRSRELLAEAIELAKQLVCPRGMYDFFERFPGPPAVFNAVHAVALGIVTIGGELEQRVATLNAAHEYPLAVALDAAGSAAVEQLADRVNEQIDAEARRRGLHPGKRISPGYGRWPVTDQRSLFELLPGREIGVSLTDECLMVPLKSISFAVRLTRGGRSGRLSSVQNAAV